MEQAIQGIQITTGILSTVASSTMATMIVRSGNSLKTPFRRLLFCLSISDVLNSGAIFLAPFLTPGNNFNTGTIASCDIQVAIFIVGGFLGVISYTFAVCLYYLCAVRYNMSDADFARKVERFLHVVIAVAAIIMVTCILASKSANPYPDGTLCYIVDSPFGCHVDPDVDCLRGEYAHWYGYYLVVLPVVSILVGMIATLGALCWTVISHERRTNRRFRAAFSASMSPQSFKSPFAFIRAIKNFFSGTEPQSLRSSAASVLTKGQKLARQRSRQTMHQASLYCIVYVFTYIGPLICVLGFYFKGKNPPQTLSLFVHLIYPLQGVFNILGKYQPVSVPMKVTFVSVSHGASFRVVHQCILVQK